ncbi:MAG: ABC transporter substrate-binding protein [Actinomycetaceae bacterium]|nr:ABC transporter substrate-binding protein [Actinomycetaceae bacterium]
MKITKAAFATLAVAALALGGCSDSTSGDANKDTAGDAAYTVGVIQLAQHPALDAATKGFEEKLTELIEADGKTVTIEVQNASGDSATAATIANGFVSDNVNLIMANATPALQAAAQATTDIPILGTSVTDYGAALDIEGWTGTGSTGFNISGTSDLAPLDKQADMVKELVPDAKKVGILYSSSEANSVYQAEEMKKNLEGLGYEVEFFTVADSNDIAAVTQKAVDSSDVLYIPTDNTLASAAETIDAVTGPAKKPVIAGESGICEGAGLATLSIDYYDLGAKTAEMAYEILVKNADPSTMDIQTADATKKQYMAERAEALGITIPDDYEAIVVEEEE